MLSTFLYDLPSSGFFIVEELLGVKGVLGRKYPEMRAPAQLSAFKGGANPSHHLP
jgi:hypothetical protein